MDATGANSRCGADAHAENSDTAHLLPSKLGSDPAARRTAEDSELSIWDDQQRRPAEACAEV
jgi:hypothetical protein